MVYSTDFWLDIFGFSLSVSPQGVMQPQFTVTLICKAILSWTIGQLGRICGTQHEYVHISAFYR